MTSPQDSPPGREPTLSDISEQISDLKSELERFDNRFSDYQKATQWVVQLAFTLIASATITVILTAVLR